MYDMGKVCDDLQTSIQKIRDGTTKNWFDSSALSFKGDVTRPRRRARGSSCMLNVSKSVDFTTFVFAARAVLKASMHARTMYGILYFSPHASCSARSSEAFYKRTWVFCLISGIFLGPADCCQIRFVLLKYFQVMPSSLSL